MSTHSLDNQMEERLINDVAELKRTVREQRTLQLQGGDAIEVIGTPLIATGATTLGSNSSTAFYITFTPDIQVLMNVDCYVSIYVDVLDDAHLWLTGASLTASQKQLRRSLHKDWATSQDATGKRVFLLTIENYSPDSHDYYVRMKCYAPKNPAVSS